MKSEDTSRKVSLIKCVIDGKDGSSEPICGLLLGAVDGGSLLFHAEFFSKTPIDTDAPLSEMYMKLTSPRDAGDMAEYENSLAGFVTSTRLLQSEKCLSDPKAIEHKITYFCSSVLRINAVSFLEIYEMSLGELYLVLPALKKTDEPEGDVSEEPKTVPDGQDDSAVTDVAAACDPVLDPVTGVTARDLAGGDFISCRLREGTAIYNLMKSASPGFDGVVTGEVKAVTVGELGSASVALKLSDGVTGVLRIPGSVRVRMARGPADGPGSRKSPPGMEIALAIAGVVAFLCVMGILVRILS
ncbi:MAG: hypothetical protein LBR87_06565 [Synergistaceae bacterium]|jgi:hypothetical protein|nr:hypothetical protein [Synergistaceae bacterium]